MNLETVCGTCLSRERRLTPLGAGRARHLHRWLGEEMDVGDRLVVCWVCRSLIDKTLLFCKRALHARKILASYTCSTQPNQRELSVTSFGVTTSCGYDYKYIHSSTDIECHDPNTEDECVDHNSEQDITYLDQDNRQGSCPHFDQDNVTYHVDLNNPIWETTIVGLEEEVVEESNEDALSSEGDILIEDYTIGKEAQDKEDNLQRDHTAVNEAIMLPKDEEITEKEVAPENTDEITKHKSINFTLIDGCSIVLKDLTRQPRKKLTSFVSPPAPNEDSDFTVKTKEVNEIKISRLKNKRTAKSKQGDSANKAANSSGKEGRIVKITMSYISESAMLARRKAEQRAEAYASSLFKCETCIVGFNNAVFLEEHNQSKHNPEIGPYQCDICALRLPSAASRANHRRAHYQLHACGACAFTTARLADATRHYAREHEPPRTYRCAQCGKCFPTIRQRKYHHAKFHSEPHQCPHCSKSFFCRNVFRQHLTLHTGRPAYVCALCDRVCRGKGALAAHMRTHGTGGGGGGGGAGGGEAYCVPCGRHYKNKYIYRQHLKTSLRHVRREDLKHGCEQCEQRFVTRRDVERHADVVHRNRYAHKCEQCERAFGDATNLKKHMLKVHEGILPAKDKLCEVCNKTFVTNNELVRHQRIHTGERPHACDICGASFRQSSALQTHRRHVHLRLRRTRRGWEPRDAQPAQTYLFPPA